MKQTTIGGAAAALLLCTATSASAQIHLKLSDVNVAGNTPSSEATALDNKKKNLMNLLWCARTLQVKKNGAIVTLPDTYVPNPMISCYVADDDTSLVSGKTASPRPAPRRR